MQQNCKVMECKAKCSDMSKITKTDLFFEVTAVSIKSVKVFVSLDWKAKKLEQFEGTVTQPAVTCSKLTMETQEQNVKYVQN